MEEKVWGMRGRDIRTSGDLERAVRVGRGPRRLPSLGPKTGGRGATSKEMRVLRRKIGVVLTSREALHQHLLIVKQDREQEFSVKPPHLQTLLHPTCMSFGVQNGQKFPLAPTFLFLGVLSSVLFHSFLSWSPWRSLSTEFQPQILPSSTLTLPCGVCFICVCVCCIQFLCRLIFASFLWPLKQNTPHF